MKRYKYPRTPHLPFTECMADDDKILNTDAHFYNMEDVIVTVKMDGENTTIYPDGTCHARSIDSKHKEYHSWLMQYIQNWCYCIGENRRVCGEYLYAKHSIKYNSLDSFFYTFSVWENNICLPWNEVFALKEKYGVCHVPVLYIGKYDSRKIIELAKHAIADGNEGIIVRNYASFAYEDFDKNVAKYVRANHVQTDKHWSLSKIEKNSLYKNK